MPEYLVTDPDTGRKLKLSGDSPPTEAELEEIFSGFSAKDDGVQQVANFVRSQSGMPASNALQTAFNPVARMSGGERFAAGAGKAVTDIARGTGQRLGMVDQQTIDETEERDRPLMNTGAGKAGNVAGTVGAFLPTSMIPGANTLTGAALIGAAVGASQPTETGESVSQNIISGAAGGAIGNRVATGLSRVLSPQTSQGARQLIDEGVELTPGQALGGTARRIEEASKSIPFVGQGISQAERRGIESFNKTALNRVLKPIGQKVDDIGHEGVTKARQLISEAYDSALNNLKRVDIDDAFRAEINKLDEMTQTLPENIQRQFRSTLKTQLIDKLTPEGTLSGEQFKAVASQFGKLGNGYKGRVNSFDQQQLGDALLEVRTSLMGLAGRTNPVARDAITKADQAYSQLLRVEDAAVRGEEGIFTPAMLAQAVKKLDQSGRKVASAQGRAVMQDLAESGKGTLSATVPNSGTTDRALNAVLLGGGYMIEPTLAAGALTARGVYSPMAQNALVKLITQRPEAIREAGNAIGRLALPAGITGAALPQR